MNGYKRSANFPEAYDLPIAPVELPDPDERPLHERHPPKEAERLERARKLWLAKDEENRIQRAKAALLGGEGLKRRVAQLEQQMKEQGVENAIAAELKMVVAAYAQLEKRVEDVAAMIPALMDKLIEARRPWYQKLWAWVLG